MNDFLSTIQNWNSIELSQPQWLWLIPLFIAINITLIIFRNKYIVNISAASLYDCSSKKTLIHPLVSILQTKSISGNKKSNFNVLYLVIFSFLVLGLSQPIRIGEKLPEPPQERDIIFIVDASVSMILRDYILNGERIDRMSLLKGVLDNFIENLKGEKMSIIVFGDQAYTLVPLTSDQYLLQRMLSRVQATVAGRFNAIGDAIALAVKQATKKHNQSGEINRKRVLVLLTDADQPTGNIDPLIAAELAKNAKLPLYTIAIGATNLAAEEIRQSGLLYSPVDLDLLERISSITGAKSYHAINPSALQNAIQAINLHETNKRKVEPQYYREELYYWFLITAFIIFSLQQLVSLFKAALIQHRLAKK